jgi:hypothetical protein
LLKKEEEEEKEEEEAEEGGGGGGGRRRRRRRSYFPGIQQNASLPKAWISQETDKRAVQDLSVLGIEGVF